MKQFDVFTNPSLQSRAFAPFVVVLQSHHLEAIETVVIAPMVVDAEPALKSIDIPVRFLGQSLWLALSELGNVPIKRLGRKQGDLLSQEDDIRRGLERLFSGF